MEREVERLAGPHGLMIFLRVDQGAVVSLARPELTELGALLDRKMDGVVAAIAR